MYKGLCLEGGGVLGCGHVGALQVLKEKGIVNNLTHFSGASAGSIIATFLACKIDIDDIEKEIFNIDFSTFKDDSYGVIRDIYRLCEEYGWYKGDALEECGAKILEKYVGNGDITLKEIHDRFGTYLLIPYVDVTLKKCIDVDHFTHPNLKVKKAVRRSSGIPLFFKSDVEVDANDIIHYFVDGGTLDNYPIRKLYKHLPKEQVIGIKLISNQKTDISHLERPKVTPSNLVEFIEILITMLHDQALKVHIDDDDWKRTIKVDIGTLSATHFKITKEEKQYLLGQGKTGAITFLNFV